MRHPSSIYMDLAADGAREEEAQLSRSRKAGMFMLVGLLLLFMPLLWVSSAQAGGEDAPQAVMSKSGPGKGGGDDDDGDNSGPGSGRDHDDDDSTRGRSGHGDDTGKDSNTANTDTATNTNSNTRTGRDDTLTNTGTNKGTGKETRAKNTDRRGLDTGKSTRGETDPGDKTGKTERR